MVAGSVQAYACSCLPGQPDIAVSYEYATDVIKAGVKRRLKRAPEGYIRYAARVMEGYKGCLEPGDRVIIETPQDEGLCGVTTLSRKKVYLLHGQFVGNARSGVPILSIGLCDYNMLFDHLTGADLAFLNSRYNCCDDICACNDGTQPVNCFADPCQFSTCDVEGAECIANYCGGCNAEWFDEWGAQVCIGDCYYNDQWYQAGDSFPDTDGCNTCACLEGGSIACTERACIEP
jgi:hypothetical protein